jgi:hypothetical protein
MQTSTLTIKTSTFYAACSPELGVVCYGGCRDEAVNNLADEIQAQERAGVQKNKNVPQSQ